MTLDFMVAILREAGGRFGEAPFPVEVDGRRYAVATDGFVIVAVPWPGPLTGTFTAGPRMLDHLAMPKEGGHVVSPLQLRHFAGPHRERLTWYHGDGDGPFYYDRQRACVLFGVDLDANRLASALQAFEGPEVRVVVGGPRDPVRLTDGVALATLMPMLIPRWGEDGPSEFLYGSGRIDQAYQ